MTGKRYKDMNAKKSRISNRVSNICPPYAVFSIRKNNENELNKLCYT